ncbi:Uncharacterised protein [Arcanobacterium haemolyticum]|nr:Uncharacterised protein [Arcanobacterium haemolyticum]
MPAITHIKVNTSSCPWRKTWALIATFSLIATGLLNGYGTQKAHASTQTGTMQQHLGCEENWSETCDRTQLTRDDHART